MQHNTGCVDQLVDPAPGGVPAAPNPGFQDLLLSRERAAPLKRSPNLFDRSRGQPGYQGAAEAALEAGLEMVEARTGRTGVQGALICLDPASGAIWALVGGRDSSQSVFDRVTMAQRQPGSAFKPIVYAYAIHSGHTQNEIILDAPVVYPGGAGGGQWRPQNFSNRYHDLSVLLEEAQQIFKNTHLALEGNEFKIAEMQ